MCDTCNQSSRPEELFDYINKISVRSTTRIHFNRISLLHQLNILSADQQICSRPNKDFIQLFSSLCAYVHERRNQDVNSYTCDGLFALDGDADDRLIFATLPRSVMHRNCCHVLTPSPPPLLLSIGLSYFSSSTDTSSSFSTLSLSTNDLCSAFFFSPVSLCKVIKVLSFACSAAGSTLIGSLLDFSSVAIVAIVSLARTWSTSRTNVSSSVGLASSLATVTSSFPL